MDEVIAEISMKPKLTVIMSAYNSSETIERAISSILNQSFSEFELIVLNDGSSDDTESKILSFTDERIKYHLLDHGGLTKALNIGISRAEAEIIVRHDSDDWSEKDRFETQVKYFEDDEELDLVASWHNVVTAAGDYLGLKTAPADDESLKRMLKWRNPFCHGSVAVRKSALDRVGGYNEALLYSQDYDLWLRMADAGIKFACIPEPLYNYSISPDSIAKGWHKLGYAKNIRKSILDPDHHSAYFVTSIPNVGTRRTNSLWNYALGSLALENGRRGQAFGYFFYSLLSDPRQWRALARLAATLLPMVVINRLTAGAKKRLETKDDN